VILLPEPYLRPTEAVLPGQTIGYSTHAYGAVEYGE
jgi:hypothetical protein